MQLTETENTENNVDIMSSVQTRHAGMFTQNCWLMTYFQRTCWHRSESCMFRHAGNSKNTLETLCCSWKKQHAVGPTVSTAWCGWTDISRALCSSTGVTINPIMLHFLLPAVAADRLRGRIDDCICDAVDCMLHCCVCCCVVRLCRFALNKRAGGPLRDKVRGWEF